MPIEFCLEESSGEKNPRKEENGKINNELDGNFLFIKFTVQVRVNKNYSTSEQFHL